MIFLFCYLLFMYFLFIYILLTFSNLPSWRFHDDGPFFLFLFSWRTRGASSSLHFGGDVRSHDRLEQCTVQRRLVVVPKGKHCK